MALVESDNTRLDGARFREREARLYSVLLVIFEGVWSLMFARE